LKPTWANSSQDPISKSSTQNMAGGVAQMAEHLSSKCEALSSNPSTDRVEKKRFIYLIHHSCKHIVSYSLLTGKETKAPKD
jgi:hypothetical protein